MSKEYKNIDDLFRDKFENFEVDPPDFVWEKVKKGMSDNSGKGSGFNFKNGGIAGISLLFISLGIIAFFFMNNSFVINDDSFEDQVMQSNSENDVLIAASLPENLPADDPIQRTINSETSSTDNINDQDKESSSKKKNKAKKTKVRSANPNRNATVYIQPEISNTIPKERQGQINITVNPFKAEAVSVNEEPLQKIQPADPSQLSSTTFTSGGDDEATSELIEAEIIRAQESPVSVSGSSGNTKSDYGEHSRWTYGIYFTPEMIIYPSDDQLKTYSNSLDLNVTYKPRNYFLQSGIGFARNHEQGNSMINYNKYLGSYEDVYNVTFDSTSGNNVPIYHTETVQVYDSIDHVIVSPVKRYYTYLQIPLFIGYGEESKRFGWFVKGGPSVSFLIHEDIPDSNIESTEAKILNVENELPGRINTNWQFILSAGATYKLGPRVSISLEPMFRYYIKSVYEQDKLNTKHPYSIGLRTGFLLNF